MNTNRRRMPRIVAVTCALVLSLATVLALAGVARGAAGAVPPGNNGTLKIHEQGTPVGTPNNDPKVCVFNVEGFNLDPGQTGYLLFTVQGGDEPTGTPAGPFAFGPANADGFYGTEYFNLDPGHYKATLYGKQLPSGELEDEKAKSKVFKVTCVGPSPSPSVQPSGSPSPSPSVSPSIGPSPSPSVQPSGSPSPSPSVSPSGGPSPSPSVSPSGGPSPSPSVAPTPTP